MSDAREQAIEVLRAHQPRMLAKRVVGKLPGGGYATEWIGDGCSCGWRPEGVRTDEFQHHRLDALLAATQDEPCETCGGDPEFDPLTEAGNRSDLPCPDCINGRRAGTVPLVLLGPKPLRWTGPGSFPPSEPVYRARLLPEE